MLIMHVNASYGTKQKSICSSITIDRSQIMCVCVC